MARAHTRVQPRGIAMARARARGSSGRPQCQTTPQPHVRHTAQSSAARGPVHPSETTPRTTHQSTGADRPVSLVVQAHGRRRAHRAASRRLPSSRECIARLGFGSGLCSPHTQLHTPHLACHVRLQGIKLNSIPTWLSTIGLGSTPAPCDADRVCRCPGSWLLVPKTHWVLPLVSSGVWPWPLAAGRWPLSARLPPTRALAQDLALVLAGCLARTMRSPRSGATGCVLRVRQCPQPCR